LIPKTLQNCPWSTSDSLLHGSELSFGGAKRRRICSYLGIELRVKHRTRRPGRPRPGGRAELGTCSDNPRAGSGEPKAPEPSDRPTIVISEERSDEESAFYRELKTEHPTPVFLRQRLACRAQNQARRSKPNLHQVGNRPFRIRFRSLAQQPA